MTTLKNSEPRIQSTTEKILKRALMAQSVVKAQLLNFLDKISESYLLSLSTIDRELVDRQQMELAKTEERTST
jgi:hypothetical protein